MRPKLPRAQIGILILATSIDPARQRLLRHLHILACRDGGLRADHIWSGPQQLFCGLHIGRVALRTDHRTGRTHSRLRRFRRDGRRRDRGDAVAAGPLAWLILRAVIGFGCAGLFITTESWLNAKADPTRARADFLTSTCWARSSLWRSGSSSSARRRLKPRSPSMRLPSCSPLALVIVSTTRAEPPRVTASTLCRLVDCLAWRPSRSPAAW